MLRFIFILIALLGIVSGIGIWRFCQLINNKILLREETIFTLKEGTGRLALGKKLYGSKMINCLDIFKWQLRLKSVKAGTYRIVPGMNIHELLHLLESGKEAQFSLRFTEGMCLRHYLQQIRKETYIQHTLKDDNYETVAKALNFQNPEQIEGWFWPDTWLYTANTTDVAILKRAHNKMLEEMENFWKYRDNDLPYKDKNQLITMASIVEKETSIENERNKVASVFINRLRIGMRLQTDVTVIYGMGIGYGGRISKKDLKIPTAYNTYMIRGLPPGPIAVPSKSSLYAAAHPDKTPYLYFVANGKGGHVFNTNLISHNQSVLNYLRILKERNAQ